MTEPSRAEMQLGSGSVRFVFMWEKFGMGFQNFGPVGLGFKSIHQSRVGSG